MTCSRAAALVLVAVCHVSCANQCKDNKFSEEEEVSVLIQNQILVQRHHANNATEQAKAVLSATTGIEKAKGNGSAAPQEVRPVAVQLDSKDGKVIVGDIPDWLKKITAKVGSFIPDTDGLKASFATVKTQAAKFGKEVDACVEKLKASTAFKGYTQANKFWTPVAESAPTFGKTDMNARTALEVAFSCLQKATNSLVDVVSVASNKTTGALKPLYQASAKAKQLIGPTVEAAQKSIIAAAAAFKTSVEESTKMFGSKIPNVTVLCQQVTKGLKTIDDKVVNLVSGMGVIYPKGVKMDDKHKEIIQSFIESLPGKVKDWIHEMTAKAREAADAVLQNFPKAITEFKHGLVSTLKGQVCDAKDLPAGASTLHMVFPLLLLVGMFLTSIG